MSSRRARVCQVTTSMVPRSFARSPPRKYDRCLSLGIASSIVPDRGVPLPAPVPVAGVHPVGTDLPVPRVAHDLDVGIIIRWANSRTIARSTSGLAYARVSSNCEQGSGTMSPAATSFPFVSDFASRRIARWPPRITALHSGNSVTSVPVTPYTLPRT